MALTPLLHKADHILLLTGTPILSRPIELYPQLFAIQKDLFPDMNQFGLRYCNGRKGKYGWDMSGMYVDKETELTISTYTFVPGWI